MSKYKELIKNTSIMAISQFSSKILVFLLVPLYTRALTTAEYGIFDLIQSTVQMLIPLVTLNILDAVMRFLMDRDVNQSNVIVLGTRYILVGSCIAIAFMTLFSLLGIFVAIQGLEWVILLYFVSSLIHQFLAQVAKGLNYIKGLGIAGILGTVITLVGNIFFLLVINIGLQGFFWANVLGQIVPSVYLGIHIKIWEYYKKQSFSINTKETNRKMLVYCVPLLANSLAWLLNSYFDKYVVAIMLGESANGLLGVAYKIPSILVTFQTIFNQAWQISAIKEYEGNESKRFYRNILMFMNIGMCFICGIMILFVKVIAHILFANDFYCAWEYVPLLLVSSVINAVAGVIGAILAAKKDSRTMSVAGIAGMVTNIVLNIILVYVMGIQGAMIATVISSFVIFWLRNRAMNDVLYRDDVNTVIVSWCLLIAQVVVAINVKSIYGYVLQVLLLLVMLFYQKSSIVIFLGMLRRKWKNKNYV